jgi:uncharacterized protein YbjT (DUF2867 family)
MLRVIPMAARTDEESDVRVLVTGATGMQGGAVARALRRQGISVTALVRDPDAAPARALAGEGIGLAVGDLEDRSSLAAGCAGHTTVFSVQPAPTAERDSERRQGGNLVRAAREAGVRHFVHTSVSGTGWRSKHPDVDPGAARNYWNSKEDVEGLVRDAGFASWTIFKPAFFMENFIAPKVEWLFPGLAEAELLVATSPETEVALIAAADLGAAVAAAVRDPSRFAEVELELGGDAPTFPAIAEIISTVTGRPVTVTCRAAEEVDARLGRKSWTATHTWLDQVGYPARPEHSAGYARDLTTFRKWAEEHRTALLAATSPPR